MLLQLIRTTDPPGYRLIGEVDASNVHELVETLEPDVRAGGTLTIDLGGLVFLDSTGIQALIRFAKDLEGRGTLVLTSPGKLVSKVLELVRLDKLDNVRIVQDAV